MSIFILSRLSTTHFLVILNLLGGINFHYLQPSASDSFNCSVQEMKAQLVMRGKDEQKYKSGILVNSCHVRYYSYFVNLKSSLFVITIMLIITIAKSIATCNFCFEHHFHQL